MRPSKNYKTIRQEKTRAIPENLKNCRECGKVFIAKGDENLCRACLRKEEVDRNRLLDYVRDNPGITIEHALKNSGVPEKIVKRMVLEGVFSSSAPSSATTSATQASRVCVICGRAIGGSGIYCKSCLSRLQRETKSVADQVVDEHTNKKRGEMNAVERLDAQIARELELENLQRQLRSKQ